MSESSTIGVWPESSRAEQIVLPIYPAPPVTNTFIFPSLYIENSSYSFIKGTP